VKGVDFQAQGHGTEEQEPSRHYAKHASDGWVKLAQDGGKPGQRGA